MPIAPGHFIKVSAAMATMACALVACRNRGPSVAVPETPTQVEADPTTGEQLLDRGLAKQAAGDLAAAQELFAEARAALERTAAARTTLDPTSGLWDASAIGWATDGSQLAVAEGPVIHVLQTQGDGRYQERLRLRTNATRVAALAFSSDAQTLAVSASDDEIGFWDLRSGHASGAVKVEPTGRRMQTLVFSRDGALLAGRAWDSPRINVWNVASRGLANNLEMTWHDQPLLGPRASSGNPDFYPAMLAFRPDGAHLLGVSDHGFVEWDLASRGSDVARVFEAKAAGLANDLFWSVACLPTGQVAAAGTESGQIVLWNLTGLRPRPLRSVPTHKPNPQVVFSRAGERLVAVAADGTVRSFDGQTLAPIVAYDAPVSWTDVAALDGDARRAAIAGAGALVIRDVDTGRLTQVIRPARALTAIAVDSNTKRVAIGTTTGEVGVLTVADGSLSWLKGHSGEVTSLAFSADGLQLASASRDTTVRIWDASTGRTVHVFAHARAVNALAYRADGQTLATGGDDGVARLLSTKTGTIETTFAGNGCPILTVSFSPGNSHLMVANASDGSLLHWDIDLRPSSPIPSLRRAACSGELGSSPSSLGFTRDGKWVAYPGPGKTVKLWNADTTQTSTLATAARPSLVRSLAVSPRDPVVVTAAADGVHARLLPQGQELPVSPATSAKEVDTIAFSDDGRWLFGVGRRGTLSIWSIAPGATALTREMTLQFSDETSGFARSESAAGAVEWLGTGKPDARCVLGAHVYPRELCEKGSEAPGLLRAVLSKAVFSKKEASRQQH